MSISRRSIVLGSLLLCANGSCAGDPPSKDVTQDGPLPPGTPLQEKGQRKRVAKTPTGLLSEHLGEYLTISGMRLNDTKTGTRTLLVDSINGKDIDPKVAISLYNVILPDEVRCTLKGYENGQMIGLPPAAIEAAKERGDPVPPVQALWQWSPHFVVLSLVEPDGLKIIDAKPGK